MSAAIDPRYLAKFFRRVAHGDKIHRAWLLAEIELFFGVKLPRKLIAKALKAK